MIIQYLFFLGVLEAVENYKNKKAPKPLDYSKPSAKGNLHVKMVKKDRTVTWSDPVEEIANTVRMSDTSPGAIAQFNGIDETFRVFGAHVEKGNMMFPNAKPGDIVGQRHGAILTKTSDGLLWLSHLKQKKLKLPASLYLSNHNIPTMPEPAYEIPFGTYPQTFQETWTTVSPEGVGYVYFNFYNGAMETQQCHRLVKAINSLKHDSRVKMVVFMGGHNYFSNGIHLNVIEHSADPAQESWDNINAINDVVKAMFSMPKVCSFIIFLHNTLKNCENFCRSCQKCFY